MYANWIDIIFTLELNLLVKVVNQLSQWEDSCKDLMTSVYSAL